MICKTQTLNNGVEMPTVGLGTWQMTDPADIERAITSAIELGYRHIDTAYIYGNEKDIGRVLRKLFESGTIKREELFITSKLWNAFHGNVQKALENTLRDLQLEYLDLYLIHWPVTFEYDPKGDVVMGDGRYRVTRFDPGQVWKEMESLVDSGLVRSIGFSNFGMENTKRILECCRIRPAVSQFELHPYLTQKELVRFLKSEGIQVVSYSSLGSTMDSAVKVRDDPTIKRVAEKCGCSPSQVILSYITMQNICVIPKSTSRQHLEENTKLRELEREDFEAVDNLGITHRYVDPVSFGPSRFL